MPYVRSIFKWPGGKYRHLDNILPLLRHGRRLIEPFVGGGSVFVNSSHSSVLINDVNSDLMLFYHDLAVMKDDFIERCRSYFNERYNSRKAYNDIRKAFNDDTISPLYRSCAFLYLNRHGFNGLCRYNRDGEFNVPFGDGRRPYFPEREMRFFTNSIRSRDVVLSCNDFVYAMDEAQAGDVVYCDPPYAPIDGTHGFTGYYGEPFTMGHLQTLVTMAQESPADVVISNHNTADTQYIFRNATRIKYHTYNSSIAASGDSRVKTGELLAMYTK